MHCQYKVDLIMGEVRSSDLPNSITTQRSFQCHENFRFINRLSKVNCVYNRSPGTDHGQEKIHPGHLERRY